MEAKYLRNSIKLVRTAISKALKETLNIENPKIPVQPFVKGKEYDYQSGLPFMIFNQLRKKKKLGDLKKPTDVANQLAAWLNENEKGLIKSADSNQKGFLFVTLSEEYLLTEVKTLIGSNDIQVENDCKKEKIVVDFSSPNIAKEMHVGHLRSTIMGEAICRLFEYLGNEVERINHVGDWGTQFGMLIELMIDQYPDYLENQPELKDLESFYKQSKKRFDEDEEFKKRAQLNVVRLQSGDENMMKAWKILCDVSRSFFKQIYKRLDIDCKEYGESFYNPMIPDVLKELDEKGLIKEDDGAKCLFIPGKKVPLMVQKSDGGYNYDTTDMAAARFRLIDWKADRIVILTDVGQFPHFDKIFRASEMAGWHKPPQTRMEHMGFGIVLGEDGGRIKTRSGKSVKLNELLDEATARAKAQLVERFEATDTETEGESKKTNLRAEDIDKASEILGIAAVKYFDMRQNRIQNYKFSYDAMLNQKGDTAVYLMYSYIRLCSILRKAGFDAKNPPKVDFSFSHAVELNMARQIILFAETLDTAQEKLQLNRICEFLYKMAGRFAEGYKQYKVLDNEHTESRLLMIAALKKMMEKCFFLLGIPTIDRI